MIPHGDRYVTTIYVCIELQIAVTQIWIKISFRSDHYPTQKNGSHILWVWRNWLYPPKSLKRGIGKCRGQDHSSDPCRKIRSGRWSAQARNVGSQGWLSILDRWSIEAWMIITALYWLVILAPKSLPMIGRESLPELSRRSFKFIKILIMTIKLKT